MSVRKDFSNIWKLHLELQAMIDNHIADTTEGSNQYYSKVEVLRAVTKRFLREDFAVLSSHQLLQLCSIVSKYRPVEPFSFLTTCSMLLEKVSISS
jgi:hypothetical protein